MIKIKEVNDLKEAEALWRALSPNKTIFDEWVFRYCFYKHEPYPLCFLAAYDEKTGAADKTGVSADAEADADAELVGLLPLEKHPKHGYEFFAEDPCEENRLFIKDGYERIIPQLYAAMPGPGKAYDISGDDEFTIQLPLEDYKYILPLADLKSFDDFLASRLSAKRRRSLVKEIEEAEKNNIIVEMLGGTDSASALSALENLFSFNTGNFGEESYLLKEGQASWRDLLALDFDWRLIVLKIKGVIQAVSLSVFHNQEWHYLITGANFKDFLGLGKMLVKVNLEAALAAKADFFDAGLGDCGWKHLWHFDKIPQYLFIKDK